MPATLRRTSPIASLIKKARRHVGDDYVFRVTLSIEQTESEMNWGQIQGKWKQAKGQAQQRWGMLTNDDLDVIDGKHDELVGKVQERYGIAKDESENQVKDFEGCCKC